MNFSNLKFIRLTRPEQFNLIPSYLFEQVKGTDIKIDKLYQFGPLVLSSPLTFFYALADKELVKGVLWAEMSPINECLNVYVLSVDKEYQDNNALDGSLEFLKKLQKECNLTKIQMTTGRFRAYEKQGWRKSKLILMEI